MKVWQCPVCKYIMSDLSMKYSRDIYNCPRCGIATLYFRLILLGELNGKENKRK